MSERFHRMAEWLLPRRRGAHIAVFLLTVLMIPGALTALQPIDMESYEMESPELTAQSIVDGEFPNAEIILGFLVTVRDPDTVPPLDEWEPVPRMADGAPDYAALVSPSDMLRPVNRGLGLTLLRGAFSTSPCCENLTKNWNW